MPGSNASRTTLLPIRPEHTEALTVVVLAHELSHAHTHLGADIDLERWDSRAFSETGGDLAGGLAQYYTWLVCQRLERQLPGVSAAFDELLRHQSALYHSHELWVETHTAEEVRLALLQVRRRGAGRLDGFMEALKMARERLRVYDTLETPE